jgi:phosphatidate phosphatase PAH1
MKVGETGEAFFVFETESDVPEDLQTSPLSGPVSDDGQGEDQGVSLIRRHLIFGILSFFLSLKVSES